MPQNKGWRVKAIWLVVLNLHQDGYSSRQPCSWVSISGTGSGASFHGGQNGACHYAALMEPRVLGDQPTQTFTVFPAFRSCAAATSAFEWWSRPPIFGFWRPGHQQLGCRELADVIQNTSCPLRLTWHLALQAAQAGMLRLNEPWADQWGPARLLIPISWTNK